jgi:tartrate/fumarate subfamily iron-sulfur-dependent hydro-lyase beta chain
MSTTQTYTLRCADSGAQVTDLSGLRSGEHYLLCGSVFTVRDATCKRLLEELAETDMLPYGLAGQMIFFAGPTPARGKRPVGSIGPTTSRRMDEATVALMDAGASASLGKGSRGEAVVSACQRNNGVYFGAVGGIAALLAGHVIDAQVVAYPELGTEALIKLDLKDFPVFVALDTCGTDWYEEAPQKFLDAR